MIKKNKSSTQQIYKKIQRFNPSVQDGLTTQQVNERVSDGLCNKNTELPTKSIKRIFCENILTLFNILNIILGFLIFYVGSYKNMLFLGVMICNTAIGIFQEIRAKKTIDKLSIISATKVNAIRNGKKIQLAIDEIVLDDMIEFSQGNQIPIDCKLISGICDVNESLLTGESDSIHKQNGDMLLSGSFIVSGKCYAKVEHISEDNYASTISAEAKYIKKINSEIMYSLRKIIKILTFILIPLAIILFIRQYNISSNISATTVHSLFGEINAHFADTIVSTVASVIGMIPEGLVLLTSTVLAVSIIRLSKYNILVQELYCIETLARVDVLCLDKTGTITEGCMEVADIISYGDLTEKETISDILCGLTSALDDTNATFLALKERFNRNSSMKADKIIPFSSEKKWSGAHFETEGSYIIGAADFILEYIPKDLEQLLEEYSRNYRSIILAHSNNNFDDYNLPKNIEVIGIILLNDKIRNEAPDTLRYFFDQNVNVKVISGDNPITVSDVARRAGIKNYSQYVDATTLKTDKDIENAVEKYTVFGRVTPAQKKKIVIALKSYGHTVAMTGDGVNDVLALKEADCSIAMATGSDAARSVSQLVLLDSNFASMPKVVAEGRRSINNIQRSSTLFMVKTIFSTLLAFLFVFLTIPYPFEPIQLTLVNAFTIGIPSFILALEPNKERIKGSFTVNIMKKAIPAGITTVINIIFCVISKDLFSLATDEYSTLAVCLTAATAMMILFQISTPFNKIRTILFITMIIGLIIGITCFSEFFSFTYFSIKMIILLVVMITIALGTFILLTLCVENLSSKIGKN